MECSPNSSPPHSEVENSAVDRDPRPAYGGSLCPSVSRWSGRGRNPPLGFLQCISEDCRRSATRQKELGVHDVRLEPNGPGVRPFRDASPVAELKLPAKGSRHRLISWISSSIVSDSSLSTGQSCRKSGTRSRRTGAPLCQCDQASNRHNQAEHEENAEDRPAHQVTVVLDLR